MVIKHVFRMKLRLPDEVLEIGDVAVHGEEVYPSEDLVGVGSSMADEVSPAWWRRGRHRARTTTRNVRYVRP